MRTPGFLVWASVLGLTGSLALPHKKEGKQENERLTRNAQFVPNSAAFLGNFNGIPVFQQSPFFHQPVLVPDTALFGQQAFGPVELVQFQNQFRQGNNQFQNQFQQGNNQFQARNGAVEQNAATLGLNQFQVETFQQANVGVFPNSHEVDTSNLGLNPTKPTRVILQTVPVVVEILDKTTGNNETELPGSVRTTSSFGAHRFDLGRNNQAPTPVTEQNVQTQAPAETAKAISEMISSLSSSASKIENIGKSATAEPLVSQQIKENNDSVAVPDVLSSLLAIGTPPSTPPVVQRKEFKKSVPLSATTTESTVKVASSPNQAQESSFSARTGGVQIPGAVAFDNRKMVLGMLGSSVVPTTQAETTVAPKQTITSTEASVTAEPSAAEQIVLEIMSRLSSQPSDNVNGTAEQVNEDIPQLLSGPEIVTPVIMVLSGQIEEAQEQLANTQKNAQPEFVIVLDDTEKSLNEQNPKKMNVGELALKIAAESTTVEVPKVKVDPKAKNTENTAKPEVVPVTDPLVDINKNLIRKRLGVASNDDVGIEHIFLKSTPGTATNNLVPETVDTEKNTTNVASLEDIMNSINSQMVAMVSPSGTLILIPMVNLTEEVLTPTQQENILNGQEEISLSSAATTTSKPTTSALTSASTTNAEVTTAPTPTTAQEILSTPVPIAGIEKILDAMRSAQNSNNNPLQDTNQKNTAVEKLTKVAEPTNPTTLDTLEQVIETMEEALVNVTSNNNTDVPVAVMKMIDEVISTMEVNLVNVTTGSDDGSIPPQTMETLNQALSNMTNALEALQNAMETETPATTSATAQQEFKKSPVVTQGIPNQQVQVLGQIVPNKGVIPSGRSQASGQTQATTATQQQVPPVSIRRFMTIPIASSASIQARSGPQILSPVTVADQVSSILRMRISNGAIRGAIASGGGDFSQRSGINIQRQPTQRLVTQPISLADQLGAEIAQHLIGRI